MADELWNCSTCGDKVPNGDHDCWARAKMNAFEHIRCQWCGRDAGIFGLCLRPECQVP